MAVIAAAVVWAAGFAFVPGARQDSLFYANGQDLMSDYRMPRTCAAASDPYRVEAIEQKDRCYAALGYVVASAFPRDILEGGIVFNAVGAGLFLLAAGLLMRGLGAEQGLILGAVALSAPFLSNIERANQAWLAGAGVMVFLAWFESECRWKRLAALAALAFAAALKITPGIFALLLLKNRRWKDLVILSVLGLALLILPFFCYGGFESFREWRCCLREHAQYYSALKGWGFVKFARTGLVRLRGVELEMQSVLYYVAAGLDLLVGLAAIWAFFRSKDRRLEIWAIGLALVLLPAVSQYYTALYLIPAFLHLAGRRLSLIEAFLWFLLLCPLQFPAGTTSLNRLLANFAVVGMVGKVVLSDCSIVRIVRSKFFHFSLFLFTFLLAAPAAWGSQAMTNLADSAAAWDCVAAYTNNTLRIEAVDGSEWNPARRMDRLPFDMPFQLVVGPDAADRAAAEAALTTVVTSMPTHIRSYFERHHLLAPLQQRMIRRFKPGVSNEEQYVTAAAHPNVWRAKDFDLVRLAAAARNLTSNSVPMMAVLSSLYEGYSPNPISRAEPLIDYPDPRPEQAYETPFGAAIVLRAMEQRRKFRFRAVGTPFGDWKVNFKWVAKQWNVRVGPFQGLGGKCPPEKGYGEIMPRHIGDHLRTDVLVFARYGEGPWGPPSVISFWRVPNERRQYDREGRIQSVQYMGEKVVIPQLYQNKPWKDVYVQDPFGTVIGFNRTRTGEFRDSPFSAIGERVLETYSSDLPKETVKVRYFTRPDDPTTLDYEETSETMRYPDKPFVPRIRGEFPLPKRKKW